MPDDELTNDPAFARARQTAAALVALVGSGRNAEPEKAAEFLTRGILMSWAQNGGLSGASTDRLKTVSDRGLAGRGAERSH
ncbi:hypothetical protein MKK50_18045 [Methylobacterium sp. J-043]|nr:hypothetical protein [Methylobacterium sp. J-043]